MKYRITVIVESSDLASAVGQLLWDSHGEPDNFIKVVESAGPVND